MQPEYDQSDISNHRHCCMLNRMNADAWFDLGEALIRAGDMRSAVNVFRKAKKLAYNKPQETLCRILISLSRALIGVGDIASAVDCLHEVISRNKYEAIAWFELSNINVVRFTSLEVSRILATMESMQSSDSAYSRIAFAVAKALEDEGRYGEAYDAFQRANAIRHREVPWDGRREGAIVRVIYQAAVRSAEFVNIDQSLGKDIVMILSLPRSGSTLLEQMLASCDSVRSVGEVGPLARVLRNESLRRHEPFPVWSVKTDGRGWCRLGNEYISLIKTCRHSSRVIIDKSMTSWRVLGLIRAMLPAAHLVFLSRDMIETCLGCYRQWFMDGNGFSNRFIDLAEHYWRFEYLTRRYALLNENVLMVSYERLIEHQSEVLHKICDFCNIEFSDRCLQFYRTDRQIHNTMSGAQVRRPIRRDTARAWRYGSLLDPLREYLAAAEVRVLQSLC